MVPQQNEFEHLNKEMLVTCDLNFQSLVDQDATD